MPDCFVCEFSDESWILAGLILTRLSCRLMMWGSFVALSQTSIFLLLSISVLVALSC